MSGATPVSEQRVLIVGAGGIGCPASLTLAKAGVRRLTLIDYDVVEASNLPRQLWHRTSDVGRPKVESAADRLRAAFPGLEVATRFERFTAANAVDLFAGHDVALDATDGGTVKFLLSDAGVLTGVPVVHAGVLRLSGQVMRIRPRGPCLRCLFESPPPPESLPTCAQAGVLGPVAGWIGARAAVLAVDPSAEPDGVAMLWRFDGDRLAERCVPVSKAADCTACSPAAKARLVLRDESAGQSANNLEGEGCGR